MNEHITDPKKRALLKAAAGLPLLALASPFALATIAEDGRVLGVDDDGCLTGTLYVYSTITISREVLTALKGVGDLEASQAILRGLLETNAAELVTSMVNLLATFDPEKHHIDTSGGGLEFAPRRPALLL